MPIQKVKGPGGKVGYRWGTHGKVYYGPSGRAKALLQAQAIYASGYKGR